MMGVKMSNHKEMSKKNKLLIYDEPKKVYIPLICSNNTNLKLQVKEKDVIKEGDIIAISENNFALPIHASVSGVVEGIEEHTCYNGSKVKCLVIKNNFKKIEEVINDKIDNHTKKQFIEILKNGGIRGLGGADFPTYVKYDNNNIKYLLINAVECEPYITADYMLMKEKTEEILECIDAIMKINKISKAYIAVKKNNKEIIDILNNSIGTYPNIILKKVPNLYPMGWEKNLVKYILHKDYKGLPIEVGAVVDNVSTIYAIYELLKYNHPLTKRIITVTGDMVKKPTNVLVRIGTNMQEVLDILDYKKRKAIIIAGGPMMGSMIDTNDLVASSSLNNILVLKENLENTQICLRCGKCSSVCPVKLSPVMIKDNINDLEMLKSLEPTRCIECGLCSYICPAKILVRNYVVEAKKKVRCNK